MQRRSTALGRNLIFLACLGAAFVTACSGGGGSSTAPQPSPTLGGSGIDVPFDQRVNFTVIVPPPVIAGAIASARRKHSLGGAAATNPYVSPKTASVTLQIGTVNGQNPRVLPAPVTFNVSCPGGNGCSIPIQNVPAAKGIDRFTVQTFSGAGGTGNVISSGYVDVTVPSPQATSFGGTALTIGGFVASISLVLNIPGGAFHWNTPASGTIDVNAIDPAGAIIIGNDQLANPIQVALPNTDAGAFTINTLQQIALQQPAQTLALAYNGSVLLGGSVTASTTDENSQPVATSVPIPVQAPPTPQPSPVASNKPPLSLYVYDAGADRIIEYAGVNNVEGGQPFSTTPRRIFEIAADPALSPNLNCAPQGSPYLESIALSSNGTIYAQTYCTDAATGSQNYIFTYAASTQEAVPAQGTPTPPVPTSSFSVTTAVPLANPQGLKLDEVHGTTYLQYIDSNFSAGNIIGVPLNGLGSPTTNLGATCLQELGEIQPCTQILNYAYFGNPVNFAVDGNGYLYTPSGYSPTDPNGNPVVPPGAPSEAVPGEQTILAYPAGVNNPAPTPLSALAGFHDEFGTFGTPQVAIEGSTIYALANPNQTTVPITGATVYAGLSGCPAPSANAVPDTPLTLCTNGQVEEYLEVFPGATQTLTSAGNAGTNVVPTNPDGIPGPGLMLGGDSVGGFGGFNAAPGDGLAVKDGFAYILNTTPPSGPQNEIDVYNLNGMSGFHTDTPPITRLVLDPSFQVTTLAIGPTGTGTGGAALLRRPARVHHDIRAWLRLLQQRRALHRTLHSLSGAVHN